MIELTKLPPIVFVIDGFETKARYVKKPVLYFPEELKNDIYIHIETFLKSKRKHTGIILHGPPGTGKTSMSEQIAADFRMDVYRAELKLYGVKDVKKIFSDAQNNSSDCPFLFVIDDFDINLEHPEIVLQLQTLLEDDSGTRPTIFVMTTNWIERVPLAIMRPGRIDLKRIVPLMAEIECRKMLLHYFGAVSSSTFERIMAIVTPHLPIAPCVLKMLIEYSSDASKDIEQNAKNFIITFLCRIVDEERIYVEYTSQLKSAGQHKKAK